MQLSISINYKTSKCSASLKSRRQVSPDVEVESLLILKKNWGRKLKSKHEKRKHVFCTLHYNNNGFIFLKMVSGAG